MYDPEFDSQHSGNSSSSQSQATGSDMSTDPAKVPAEIKAAAVMLNCPYCRKKFDRANTKAMPFCSTRCKMIDLGLWLNEVHSIPYDVDPGPE